MGNITTKNGARKALAMKIDGIEVRLTHNENYAVSCDGRVCRVTPTRRGTVWLRPGRNPKNGYMHVSLQGKSCYLHRLVYAAWIGPILDGLDVSHVNGDQCDNQSSNLIAETRLENIRRKSEHGTQPRGEEQNCSRLTVDEVRRIRELYLDGFTSYSGLAKMFRVCVSTIASIIHRRTWKHVA